MIHKLSAENKEKLQRLEETLWIEETRFDRTYMDRVLAEDFFEIGRSGRIYQREDILSASRRPINAVIPLPDFAARFLTDEMVQVTYNSEATYGGVVERGRRSSIWSRAPDGWVLRFHQGTPFDDVA